MGDLSGILSSLDPSSSIQLVYVGALLGLLSGAVFLVVRQVLFRTQLEEATKELSEKARTGDATYDEYYELGVLLIRKKLFATALKHLDSAKRCVPAPPPFPVPSQDTTRQEEAERTTAISASASSVPFFH